MIQVDNLTVEANKKKILSNISISIERERFTAILGPNGAGKSTLLKSLAGIHKKSLNLISINGKKLSEMTSQQRALLISWIPANFETPFSFTIYDIVMMGRYPWHQGFPKKNDHKLVEKSLEKMSLNDLQKRTFLKLSSGEQKRVMIARALAQDTPIILLDEPSAHLDLAVSLKTMKLLKNLSQEGKTVCACLHDLNLAKRFSDHFLLLKEGKLHTFGAIDTKLNQQIIQDVFSIESEFIKDGLL